MCKPSGPFDRILTEASVARQKSKDRKAAAKNGGQPAPKGKITAAGVLLVCFGIVCLADAHQILHAIRTGLTILGGIVALAILLTGLAWWKRPRRPARQAPCYCHLGQQAPPDALPWQQGQQPAIEPGQRSPDRDRLAAREQAWWQ